MDIQQFEKELLSKLQFKASSKVGVETVLLKIFKFFDLSNEGFLRKQDFLKAIAKAGVTISEREQAESLWQTYSQNDVVDYKEFISRVVVKDTESQFDYQANNPNSVLDQLRAKIQLKGSLGLLQLANTLPQQFTAQQLGDVLRNSQVDVDNLYQLFQGEFMSVAYLMNLVKGPYLSQLRQNILANIYYTFDQGGVTPQYLTSRYNTSRHPEIRILNKSAEELREEFLTAISLYLQIRGVKQLFSFQLTDFFDFYSYFGFYIQNDELFKSIVNTVWIQEPQQQNFESSPVRQQLNFSPQSQQQQQQHSIQPISQLQFSPESAKQAPQSIHSRQSVPKSQKSHQSQQSQLSATSKQVELIVQRIRNRLISRGARGFISLYRVGRILDADHDGLLNLSEFRRAIRDHRIEVTDPEIDLVFQYFDRETSGVIDLWGFMFVLRGEMNPYRVNLVESLFEKYRTEEFVQLRTLKNNFFVRNHPDLKNGKKSDDEIIADFFEPLSLLHNINGGFGNENISKEELLEYFSNYCASIPDDKYFEQIMINVFKLNQDNLKTHHAGNKQVFDPDHKRSYLQDHHRYVIQGGSVSQNAPFGTFNQQQQETPSRPQSAYQQPQSFNIFKPLEDPRSNRLGESQLTQQSQQYQQQQQQQQQPSQRPQSAQIHYQMDATPKQSSKRVIDSFQALKNKILSRGLRGIVGIQYRFLMYDKAHLGAISYAEWIKCFKQWRLDVTENVLQEVFNQYQSNGMMIYDSFIKQLQGTMTLKKFNIVQQAFESLPGTTVDIVINQFCSKDHPDVRFNRRREEDVLCEFIDTFEQYHSVFTGSDYIKSPNVVFEEFIGYHNNLSALIEDDSHFEQLLNAIWNLKRRL